MNEVNQFLKHLRARGFAPGTIGYKRGYLQLFFSYLTRQRIKNLQDVTPSTIESYKTFLLKRKNPFTKTVVTLLHVARQIETVNLYFRYLIQRERISFNPVSGFNRRRFPRPFPKKVPSEEEVRRLMETPRLDEKLGFRNRAMFELVYSTGIRRQELINLNIHDVNLAEGTLRVNKGKGGKDRVVPIGKTACYYVEEYIKKIRNRRASAFEPALFISRYGDRLKTHTVSLIIRQYREKIGITTPITWHSLRHACATHMLRHGAQMAMIQKILGHTKISTTEIYTHLHPKDLKEIHKKHHPHGRKKR